jgi:hypothetical protein
MLHPTPEERLLYSSSHGGGKEGKENTIILNEKVFFTTDPIDFVLFVCSPCWPQTHVPPGASQVLELQVCPAPFEQKIVNKGIL